MTYFDKLEDELVAAAERQGRLDRFERWLQRQPPALPYLVGAWFAGAVGGYGAGAWIAGGRWWLFGPLTGINLASFVHSIGRALTVGRPPEPRHLHLRVDVDAAGIRTRAAQEYGPEHPFN